MDWLTIIFLLLFLVLPLIEQLRARRNTPRLPDEGDARPTDEQELERRSEAVERHGVRQPLPEAAEEDEVGWSAGWGKWPEFSFETPAEGEATEPSPTEVPTPAPLPTEAVSLESTAPPLVVSLEPTRIDRAAEHARFRARTAAPAPVAPALPPRALGAVLAGMLREREGLRRAVVLAEVLGPPRSLQPIDSEPNGS